MQEKNNPWVARKVRIKDKLLKYLTLSIIPLVKLISMEIKAKIPKNNAIMLKILFCIDFASLIDSSDRFFSSFTKLSKSE